MKQATSQMIGKIVDWEYPNRANGSGGKWEIIDRTIIQGMVEYLAKSESGETRMIMPHWITFIHGK